MDNQLDKLNAKLLGLRKNVTTDDRTAAESECVISRQRISLYLNGKGESIDTGMKLFQFFAKRINKRRTELEKN